MISKHANSGEDGFYGYGTLINDEKLGGKIRKKVYHSGGIPGFYSANNVFPDEDIQIIAISNIRNEYFYDEVSRIESIAF